LRLSASCNSEPRLAIFESPIGAFTAASVLGDKKGPSMRGVILWLLGVPISVIILLYLFNVL
jgi:hypothetical protein